MSGVSEEQDGPKASPIKSAQQHCTLQPLTVLSPEAVNVLNTPITATNTFRQIVARPPLVTDRVTRLDARKMLGTTHAFQTSATLNLDE